MSSESVGSGIDPKRGSVTQTPSIAQVNDLYEKGSYLYSTRTAEAFEAFEKATGQRVILWTLRYPLAPGSEFAIRFVERLKRVTSLVGATPPIKNFGVDSRGTAYLATEYFRGRGVLDQTLSSKMAERLFIEMLQILAPLHLNGILLSDIALDSFQLNERGQLLLVGILGSFEAAARSTAILPPVDTLHFLAPEQRGGTGAELASDVYALGVLGYRLFTGRFLQGDKTDIHPSAGPEDVTQFAPPPSTVKNDVPHWADDVIGRSLDPQPGQRFRDASEMMEVILKSLQTGIPPGGENRWSKRSVIPTTPPKGKSVQRGVDEARPESGLTTPEPRSMKERKSEVATNRRSDLPGAVREPRVVSPMLLKGGVTLVVGMVFAGLLFLVVDRWSTSPKKPEDIILKHTEYAPPDLKALIFDLAAEALPIDKREEALAKIAEHEDPIAYSVLQAMFKSNYDGRLKSKSQQLLVERIKRQGRERSSDILGRWFAAVQEERRNPADLPLFPLLFRAADASKPVESRLQALEEAYKLDSVRGLQMTAALMLDEGEKNYLPLLRKLLTLESPEVDFSNRGVGALLLSSNALAVFMDLQMLEMIERFSDDDLKWAMLQVSKFDNSQLFDIAKEVLRRKAIPPFQAVFLKTLVDGGRFTNAGPVQRALVKGSIGKLSQDDILQFGKWMSMEAEPVLLAACATISDPELGLYAFDTLAGRTLQTEPANSLLAWVKSRYWDYRKKLVKSIGVIGLIDVASDEDIKFAFEPMMPFATGNSLFRVLIGTKQSRIINEALSRFGEVMTSDELLPLLSHKNKQVRMQAVRALKGRNELVVLQGILREYNREQDEEVKAVYRELHWVTQDRERAKGAGVATPPAAP